MTNKGIKLTPEWKKRIGEGVKAALKAHPEYLEKHDYSKASERMKNLHAKGITPSKLPHVRELARKLMLIRNPLFNPEVVERVMMNRHPKHKNIATLKAGTIGVDSSYEEKFLLLLDSDPQVKSVCRSRARVKYECDGKKRVYYPDFDVTFNDGKVLTVEVKAQWALENPKYSVREKMKIEAAHNFLPHYFVATEQEIEMMQQTQFSKEVMKNGSMETLA